MFSATVNQFKRNPEITRRRLQKVDFLSIKNGPLTSCRIALRFTAPSEADVAVIQVSEQAS